MSHIDKEKLIKADIASIENRVRHAFNQGYDLGYKEGKANCSEIPTGSTTKNDAPKYCDRSICLKNEYNNVGCEDCEVTKSQEPTTKNNLGVDLISRADVLKLMQDNWHTHNGDWAMQESMDDIRALPSVTPQEPKTGHWIDINGIYAECSNCNEDIYITEDFKFCPNCGADMREVEE